MTSTMKTYEAMFLLDAGNPDFEAACAPIRRILERNEADVKALKLWEDRRLAYEIKGRRRGYYVLTYFSVDPLKVKDIEHDCQLDEEILRVLVLRKDLLTEEEINAETPASTMPAGRDETSEDAAGRDEDDVEELDELAVEVEEELE